MHPLITKYIITLTAQVDVQVSQSCDRKMTQTSRWNVVAVFSCILITGKRNTKLQEDSQTIKFVQTSPKIFLQLDPQPFKVLAPWSLV